MPCTALSISEARDARKQGPTDLRVGYSFAAPLLAVVAVEAGRRHTRPCSAAAEALGGCSARPWQESGYLYQPEGLHPAVPAAERVMSQALFQVRLLYNC